eukprot:CAMPEP_0172487600 /NCGR_PEP_ID=MMETSP1066-20121228/16727_1 /TAXON_ID=671091 /ORGANISM="Coscinodiscus wailesii, Strain CCMP2513" /LENGTH=872 /DNA_ID=CAMNT_0013254305 /DNA_START=162 /DNA_END=2780 /DNA_ORIENTATION=-
MKQHHFLLFLLALITTLPSRFGYGHTSLPINDEEDYYEDVAPSTKLQTYIDERKWDRVRVRLRTHPEEAATLVVSKRHHRLGAGDITGKSMALHRILEMEMNRVKETAVAQLSEDGGGAATTSTDADDEDVVIPHDVIEAVLAAHPDATRVKNYEHYLPLHLASYANLDVALLKSIADANPDAIRTVSSSPYNSSGDGDDDDGGKNNLPLHCAASFPTAPALTLSYLLSLYPEAINAPDNLGDLPLHVAVTGDSSVEGLEVLHRANPEGIKRRGENGYTALHLACKYSKRVDVSVLRFLAEADPEAGMTVDDYGLLPLHSGLKFRILDMESVRFLIERFPQSVSYETTRRKVGEGEEEGSGIIVPKIALHFAFDQCCIDRNIVNLLLESYPPGAGITDRRGNLPLHLACREEVDDGGTVEDLLAAFPDAIRARNDDGELPLHLILRWDNDMADEVARILIREYPEGAAVTDKEGDIAVHRALRMHKGGDLIYSLLHAYPDGAKTKAKSGDYPLHVAARGEHYEDNVFQDLLSIFPGAAKARDTDGLLPLHLACQNEEASPIAVQIILNAHPDAAKIETPMEGNLPLHLASNQKWQGSEKIVDTLLVSYPDAAKHKNKEGLIPLHLAAKSNTWHGIYLHLLSSYPDSAAVVDPEGNLPIHWACKHSEFEEAVTALINDFAQGVKMKDSKGDLPLHICVRHRASLSTIKNLLHHHPTAISETDYQSDLPIHIALVHDLHWESVLFLLAQYPDAVTAWEKRHYLPIHLAAMYYYPIAVFRSLIDIHPQGVRTTDDHGRLPLHIAVQVGASDGVVEFLLRVYPEALEVEDNQGRTPMGMLKSVRVTDDDERRHLEKILGQSVDYWKREVDNGEEEL